MRFNARALYGTRPTSRASAVGDGSERLGVDILLDWRDRDRSFMVILFRTRWHMVLFLRRFENKPAFDAVSGAVQNSAGLDRFPSQFRLVTLRDGVAEVGAAPGRSLAYALLGWVPVAIGVGVVSGAHVGRATAPSTGAPGLAVGLEMLLLAFGVAVSIVDMAVRRRTAPGESRGHDLHRVST